MLVPETYELVGRLLEIKPMYGWGWHRFDEAREPVDYSVVDAAGPFTVRLNSLWELDGQLRGGIGRVEHPGHPFHEYWAVFWTMSIGTWELRGECPPRIDIDLGPDEPLIVDGRPAVETGTPRIHGHVKVNPLGD